MTTFVMCFHDPERMFATHKFGWWTDDQFVGRAEHDVYLKAWLERIESKSQADDFDSFLDSDETLP